LLTGGEGVGGGCEGRRELKEGGRGKIGGELDGMKKKSWDGGGEVGGEKGAGLLDPIPSHSEFVKRVIPCGISRTMKCECLNRLGHSKSSISRSVKCTYASNI
jgi:hypothetical protein